MADLGTLRQKLVKQTGRYDLVKSVGGDDWVDNGANDVLNRAQRLLDSLIVLPHHKRRHMFKAAIGDWKVTFSTLCRGVEQAWCAEAGGTKWPLNVCGMDEIRNATRGAARFTDIDPGLPVLFAPMEPGLSPDQIGMDAEAFADYADWEDLLLEGDDTVYTGILFLPPTDRALTVSVWGTWLTPDLTDDDSISWWSVNEPALLLKAAREVLEGDIGNREGINDIRAVMAPDLQRLDFDQAERESARYRRIEK